MVRIVLLKMLKCGSLVLEDDNIELKAVSTTDTYLSAANGGGVSLRFDNSVKAETVTGGFIF